MFDREERARATWLWQAVAGSELAAVGLDADALIREWSDGAARLFGWSAVEAIGRRWDELGPLADPVRRRQAEKMVRDALSGLSWSGEWTGRDRAGGPVSLRTVAQPLHDEQGAVVGVLLLSLDVSERDAFQDALVRQAMHDPLTGLQSRSLVVDQLTRSLSAHPGAGPAAAVLFIDLDGFKDVNDRYGHGPGDEVLIEVSRRLRSAVRDGDAVGRMGGDEFLVLCRSSDPERGAAGVARRISDHLGQPIETSAGPIFVTASIGGVLVTPDTDPVELLHRADAAMYRAKTAGRGGYEMAAVEEV